MVHVVGGKVASKSRKIGGYVQHAMVPCPGRDNGSLWVQGRQWRVALELGEVEGGKRGKSCSFLSTCGRYDDVDVVGQGDWI